jgi:hypothetical protein
MEYLRYGYGAQYINLFIDYSKRCINYVSELISFTYKKVNANTLVFFDKNPTPYLSSFLDLEDKNSAIVLWKFDLTKRLFYQYNCSIKDTKKYPIMTAFLEIYDSDDSSKKDIIYLDDFLNSIHIEASNFSLPTLEQLIEVWSYTNGIVLNRNNTINFVYIDLNANEVSLDVFSENFSF